MRGGTQNLFRRGDSHRKDLGRRGTSKMGTLKYTFEE